MRTILSSFVVVVAVTLKLVAQIFMTFGGVFAFWAMKLMEFAIFLGLGKEELKKARKMADEAAKKQ